MSNLLPINFNGKAQLPQLPQVVPTVQLPSPLQVLLTEQNIGEVKDMLSNSSPEQRKEWVNAAVNFNQAISDLNRSNEQALQKTVPINLETLGIGEQQLKVSSVSLLGQEIEKSQPKKPSFENDPHIIPVSDIIEAMPAKDCFISSARSHFWSACNAFDDVSLACEKSSTAKKINNVTYFYDSKFGNLLYETHLLDDDPNSEFAAFFTFEYREPGTYEKCKANYYMGKDGKMKKMEMITPTGKLFTVSDFDNEGHFGHLSGKDENNNVFEDIEINNNIEE